MARAARARYLFGFKLDLKRGFSARSLATTAPAVMSRLLGKREIGGRTGTSSGGSPRVNDPIGIRRLMIGMLELANAAMRPSWVVVREFVVEDVGRTRDWRGRSIPVIRPSRVTCENPPPPAFISSARSRRRRHLRLAAIAHGSGCLAVSSPESSSAPADSPRRETSSGFPPPPGEPRRDRRLRRTSASHHRVALGDTSVWTDAPARLYSPRGRPAARGRAVAVADSATAVRAAVSEWSGMKARCRSCLLRPRCSACDGRGRIYGCLRAS